MDGIGILAHYASGGGFMTRQSLPLTITDDDSPPTATVTTAEAELTDYEVPSLTLTSSQSRQDCGHVDRTATKGSETVMGYVLWWARGKSELLPCRWPPAQYMES